MLVVRKLGQGKKEAVWPWKGVGVDSSLGVLAHEAGRGGLGAELLPCRPGFWDLGSPRAVRRLSLWGHWARVRAMPVGDSGRTCAPGSVLSACRL